jgi:hypothetical protein
MSNSSAVSRRAALTVAGSFALIFTAAAGAAAQSSEPDRALQVRVTSGSFAPTGSQRDALESAHVTAAQISWLIRPSLAITGSFSWARSKDLTLNDTPRIDVFTTDLGVETRGSKLFANGPISIRPFAGLGGGMRSYDYRTLAMEGTHNLAGYGAIGAELGIGRVGVRLEARDYVSGFKPLAGVGTADTRNDMVITAAVSLNRSRARQN